MKNLFIISLLIVSNTTFSIAAQEVEPVHYAYANYLGSGIYRTTGQNASLLSMPFSYELGHEDKTTYELRLPVSVGFFDFDFADLPELELPNEVGTITFTPGVAFKYQYTRQWSLETYIDIGYARNLTTGRGVSVQSTGVSAIYDFEVMNFDSIWANRMYYANYKGNGYEASDSYAAFQIGIDTGLPLKYQVFGYSFQPRIFATAFWYFSEVNFFTPSIRTANELAANEENNVTLTNSVELGFTLKFDKKIGYSWAGIERLGLSYRYSENFSAFRLLFSFPI